MKEKETITMTKKEIRRLKIINELVDNKISRSLVMLFVILTSL